MGGDRRSPPHHRSKGGGGVKVKGRSVLPKGRDSKGCFSGLKGEKIDKTVKSEDIPISTSVMNRNDNLHKQDCRSEDEFSTGTENRDFLNQEDVEGADAQGPNSSKAPLVVARNSFSKLSGNDSQICNFKTGNSHGNLEIIGNLKDIGIGQFCVENRKFLDQEMVEADSINGGKLYLQDSSDPDVANNVLENYDEGSFMSHDGPDRSDIGDMQVNLEDGHGCKPDLRHNQEEAFCPGVNNWLTITNESMISDNSTQIKGMTFNVHNPMFWDEDRVSDGNGNLPLNENMDDTTLAVQLEGREGVCVNVAPSYQHAIKTPEGVNVVEKEDILNGRKTDGNTGPSRSDFTAPNVWKKPNHVQVNWENKGKATEDGKFVNLNMEEVQRNQLKLERALVGRLIGKKMPYHILSCEIKKRWDPFGDFKFLMIGDDCFTCIFNSVEARDAVLMGGPWLIGGYILGLDKWSPFFSHESMNGLTAPVWIRLPQLPLLYWDNDNLARIASMIGQPLWIDAQTSDQGRCSYARVCVRLDLAQKMHTGVWIHGISGNFFQKVEYEGIHQVCFKCGHIGHKEDKCLSNQVNVRNGFKATKGVESDFAKPESKYIWKEKSSRLASSFLKPGNVVGQGVSVTQTKVHEAAEGESECCVGSVDSQVVVREDRAEAVQEDSSDDQIFGPWIFVGRKGGKARGKGGDPRLFKNRNFRTDNWNNKNEKGKGIVIDSKDAGLQVISNATDVFSAVRKQAGFPTGESGEGPSKLRNGKERLFKSPGVSDVSNFTLNALWPRKRRKEALLDEEVLDVQNNEGAAKENGFLSIEGSTDCGGDASPFMG